MPFQDIVKFLNTHAVFFKDNNKLGGSLAKLAPNNERIKVKVKGSYRYKVAPKLEGSRPDPVDLDF